MLWHVGEGCYKERERSVSHSGAQLQAEGGMGPGTGDFCVEAVLGAFLRLSRELSLPHTMCVGGNTLIGQNMLNIVKSCNEMKCFILH